MGKRQRKNKTNTKQESEAPKPTDEPRRKKHRRQDGVSSGEKAKNDFTRPLSKQKIPGKQEKLESESQERWSKSKKKRMRRVLAKQKQKQNESSGGNEEASLEKIERPSSKPILEDTSKSENSSSKPISDEEKYKKKEKLSKLQSSFLDRLSGSRFRELNEELYTTSSNSAFTRFQNNPELFEQYHEGFRSQVKQWPENPVDVILRRILAEELRTRKMRSRKLIVADFGCGDAKLAAELLAVRNQHSKHRTKQKLRVKEQATSREDDASSCSFEVRSFDLVSNGNELITPCDMANVPLGPNAVDIAVFSLALMGTNIADFIREAHRVLRPDGLLEIAEVRSRFESTASTSEQFEGDDVDDQHMSQKSAKGAKGANIEVIKKGDDTLLNDFLDSMKKLGFSCMEMDRANKMFVLMEFKKTGQKPAKDVTFTAKPCIYKRR